MTATCSRVACVVLSYSISMREKARGCRSNGRNRKAKSALASRHSPGERPISIGRTVVQNANRAFTRSSGSRPHDEAHDQQFAERPYHALAECPLPRGSLARLRLLAAARLPLRSRSALCPPPRSRGCSLSGLSAVRPAACFSFKPPFSSARFFTLRIR